MNNSDTVFSYRHALVLLPFHHEDPPPDAQTWFVNQTLTIPNDDHTFYWCHIEKIPKWDKKHHYIGVFDFSLIIYYHFFDMSLQKDSHDLTSSY